MPHRTAIQTSFGKHDVSGIAAHTDNAAATGARQMGAEAFTRGDHVAFAGTPDLHVAAHEAAHAVQQRSGLDLPGGAGQKSDRHEQHAEAVANRVAQGCSSEDLLDSYTVNRAKSAGNRPVQRFESEEHQKMGNDATKSAVYNLGSATDKFELTHGDILALSGDVFEPNELFRLAAIPGQNGQKVGSRDEVLWALREPSIWEMRSASSGPFAGQKDPRFEAGGPYASYVFSDAVKAAVIERYQKLGAANAGHFVSPQGRDAKNAPLPAASSAGSNYRSLHEVAIKEADKAGRAGADVGMAMAREAAAQHFLTDAFSAGHLRTPAAAIREYWGNKYPLFWFNLRHKIALDTAINLAAGTIIPTHDAYLRILAQVEAMAPTLPPVTLGDLLSSVFHDVDNEQGLKIEGGGKVMGDSHLDTATENLALGAIQAGNKDIATAFGLGIKMTTPVPDADLFGQVRLMNGGTSGLYAPELKMPVPDKTEPPQNWKAADITTLWDQKLLGATGDTVGQTISARVQGGSIAVQLNALGDKFPVDQRVDLPVSHIDVHPRASYLQGFVRNLQADPKAGVMDIVNWAPHGMSTGNAPRETGQELVTKGAAGDPKENLSNMTLEQRVSFVNGLINDGKDADKDMIIKIFENATAVDRKELYKRIEGHVWSGDFQRSFGSRDRLFKALDDATRVDKVKNSINGT